MAGLKSISGEVLYRLQEARFHRVHKRLAATALQQIEQTRGKTNRIWLQQSEAYAREVLGWKGYAPWLTVYSALAGEFREGWVPDNYYGWVVAPRLQGSYGQSSALRRLALSYFGPGFFPDLAYQLNGLVYGANGETLDAPALLSILFTESEQVVFKQDHSYQGKGIHIFDRGSFKPENVGKLGNGVWQPFIAHHPVFDRLSPRATASLRITTVTDDAGIPTVRACYLRLGRAVDSHVQSATGIKVPVDRASGCLAPVGYLPDWRATERHPDTQALFYNIEIPGFANCLRQTLELHARVPFVRAIGWDLTIDREGQAAFLEWNGYQNDIKFSEATQGPCFTGLGWENLWSDKGRGTTRLETSWHPI